MELIPYHEYSQADYEREKPILEKYREELRADKEKLWEFMMSLGVYNEDGTLKEEFRSDAPQEK